MTVVFAAVNGLKIAARPVVVPYEPPIATAP